jgi:hypothetical protein
VIKFVIDLQQVGGFFFAGTSFPSSSKIDRHDITEILLKMALNTIKANQANPFVFICKIFVPGKEKCDRH